MPTKPASDLNKSSSKDNFFAVNGFTLVDILAHDIVGCLRRNVAAEVIVSASHFQIVYMAIILDLTNYDVVVYELFDCHSN